MPGLHSDLVSTVLVVKSVSEDHLLVQDGATASERAARLSFSRPVKDFTVDHKDIEVFTKSVLSRSVGGLAMAASFPCGLRGSPAH